jgi:hypothetical protein
VREGSALARGGALDATNTYPILPGHGLHKLQVPQHLTARH